MLHNLLQGTIKDTFFVIDPTPSPPINIEAINLCLFIKYHPLLILYSSIFVNCCKAKPLLYIPLWHTRFWNLLTSPQSNISQRNLQCVVIKPYFPIHFTASIVISNPPTMTKRTASRFFEAVRIARRPYCRNSRLQQCFLLTLFTKDCEKPKDFAISLVLLPLINNTKMSTFFALEIGFIMPILPLQLH
jgi:hypothetical protein